MGRNYPHNFSCFQSYCFKILPQPLCFDACVTPYLHECYILNRVCSSRSLNGPSEPLPVVCLEPHEPQVVLSALPVLSPLPQRVCWHQHPQWLLSALEHSAVTTQDFWTHSLCWLPLPRGSEAKMNGGHFQRNQKISGIVCVLCRRVLSHGYYLAS